MYTFMHTTKRINARFIILIYSYPHKSPFTCSLRVKAKTACALKTASLIIRYHFDNQMSTYVTYKSFQALIEHFFLKKGAF